MTFRRLALVCSLVLAGSAMALSSSEDDGVFILNLPDGSIGIGQETSGPGGGGMAWGKSTAAGDGWLYIGGEMDSTVTVINTTDDDFKVDRIMVDPTGNEYSGYGKKVAANHKWLAVWAPHTDNEETVWVHDQDNDFAVIAQITPPHQNWVYGDFGAAIALHDDTLVIGAPGANKGGGGIAVYELSESGASLIDTVNPYGQGEFAQFGHAITISEELPTEIIRIAVSAPNANEPGEFATGRVRIYEYDYTSLTFDEELGHPKPDTFTKFGWSLAMHKGQNLVVGCDPTGEEIYTKMYAYSRDDAWSLSQELSYSREEWNQQLGHSMAIGDDGLLISGMPGDDGNGESAGAVVTYEYLPGPGLWVESSTIRGYGAAGGSMFGATITAGNYDTGEPRQFFVSAIGTDAVYAYASANPGEPWVDDLRMPAPVRLNAGDVHSGDSNEYPREWWDISADDNVLVVGEVGTASGGAVTVYRRDLSGAWVQEAWWDNPRPLIDSFGAAVAISSDVLVIGGFMTERVVWTSTYDENTGSWSDLQEVPVPATGDSGWVGNAVAIDVDTNGVGMMLVSEYATTLSIGDCHVHAYLVNNSKFDHFQTITTPNSGIGLIDEFGASVDVHGDRVAIGAPYKVNESMIPVGAAYVYKLNSGSSALVLESIIEHPDSGEILYSRFGHAIDLHDNSLIIGAPHQNREGESDEFELFAAGGAWVTEWDPGLDEWTELTFLDPLDQHAEDLFGFDVAMIGDEVIVAAPGSDYGDVNAGLLWRFIRTTTGWTCSEALLMHDPQQSAELGYAVALARHDLDGDPQLIAYGMAPWQHTDDGGLGTVATFDLDYAANWIGGDSAIWNIDDSINWSVQPSMADRLRVAPFFRDYVELQFTQNASIPAALHVMFTDLRLTSSANSDLAINGALQVASPAHLGDAELHVATGGLLGLYGPVIVGGEEGIGSLAVMNNSRIRTLATLGMGAGSCLVLWPPLDATTPAIECQGDPPVLQGTLDVHAPAGTPQLGDSHVLITAPTTPLAGEDTFDMIISPQLSDPSLALQVNYETDKGGNWKVVADVVAASDVVGFGTPGSLVINGNPVDITTADLDGDGTREVCVVFGGLPGTLVIYGADGTGGITPLYSGPAVADPVGITTGDFNGDMNMDIALGGGLSQQIQILFGSGSMASGFEEYLYDMSGQVSCVTRVNANNDELDDLMVGVRDTTGNGNGSVELLLGASSIFNGGLSGGGSFTIIGDPVFGDPSDDEDQKTHIIGTGGTSTGRAFVVKGAAGVRGESTTLTSFIVGAGLSGVANIDIDGDGDLDMTLSSMITDDLIVLRQTPDGSFTAPLYTALGNGPRRLQTVDLDDDGTKELAVITTDEAGNRVVRTLYADGGMAFTSVDSAAGDAANFFASGDVTGDRVPDLITIGTAPGYLTGNATLSLREQVSGMYCVGDANTDGAVTIDDLLAVIAEYGNICADGDSCNTDWDNSGVITIEDLLLVIANYGLCGT